MAKKNATIVVVDDNPGSQYATVRVLEKAGFHVLSAGTGQAALELAQQHPDLFILDVNLPDMHGFEICRRLRTSPETQTTPIIHLSASLTSGADQVQGLDVGADAYLVHPVEPPVLVATVKAFLRAREAENKLRESEARFRKMADAAPAMLWISDAEYQCTFLSGAWQEFTGQSEQYGLKMGWLACLHADDKDQVLHQLANAVRARESFSTDCRVRRHDGDYRWVVLTGRPLFDTKQEFQGHVGCVIEIHDRKIAEAALQMSEEKFRTLADNISQLAWMADRKGVVTWFNQRWLDYTGVTPEQSKQRGWENALHPDNASVIIQKYQDCVKRGATWEDVFQLRGKDGTYRWFLSHALPIRNEAGEITRWFGTNTDVTEQRRSEEQRAVLLDSERAARVELDRAGRMKDEFLGTLSHELRTPLNAILGWAHLMRGDRRPENIAAGIEVIDRNARAQAQLISDLLDISRVISGKLRLDVQSFSFGRVIDAAMDSVRHAAKAKQIHLSATVDPALSTSRGDPARLQQVVWNLLSNAIKFTPKDGHVSVLATRVNSHVELSVSDTGKGIQPEFLGVIFDRFRQADSSASREHGGLGIGLALVRQIVELHGGSVKALSDGPDLGTTIVVTLPIAAVTPEDEVEEKKQSLLDSRTQPSGEPPKLSGCRILIVDDDPDALNTVSRVLLECNADVTPVDSAQAGLAALRRGEFHLIISDIGMPILDGYEFIRRVRESGCNAPALALTAFARDMDQSRALQVGFQSHLSKPVDPWLLLKVVASLVAMSEHR